MFAPAGEILSGLFDGRNDGVQAKICGIKTIAAAKAAAAGGAGFIGFIFWTKSHRFVAPEIAAQIARAVTGVRKVGVFVDEEPARVNAIAEAVGLDLVQLHGTEDAAYAKKIERPIIKAYRYDADFDARAAADFPAAYVILDSGTAKMPGGTGRNFAWREAARTLATVPELRQRLLIAGGVARENLRELHEIFHPFGVDVSGSLETNKEKDIEKIHDFLQELRVLNAETGEKIA